MHSIQLQAVSRRFGSQFAIEELSLHVAAGECVVVVGKSGAGKSTVLRIVAGLESVDRGSVWIDDQDQANIPASRRHMALVTQDAALYPQLSVRQNLMVRLKSMERKQALQRAEAALDAFGMLHLQDRLPSELSGGESQRAALAKAMASQPRILLLDEPFSQLDALIKEPILNALYASCRASGTTTLMVSHDPLDSLRLADRIAVLDGGRLVQCAEPEKLYRQPSTRLAGDLLSPIPMNWIDRRTELQASWRELFKSVASSRHYLGFRPEAVELLWEKEASNEISANEMVLHIVSVQSLGFAKLLLGTLDGQSVRVLTQVTQLPADLTNRSVVCRIRSDNFCAVEE